MPPPPRAFVTSLNGFAASLRCSHFDLAPLVKRVKRNRWWRTWTDASGTVHTYHSYPRWCTNVLSVDSGTANRWITAYDGLLGYGIRRGSAQFTRAINLGVTRVDLMRRVAGSDRVQFIHLLTTGPSTAALERMLGRQTPQQAVVEASVIYIVRRLRTRGPINYDYLQQGSHRTFTAQISRARQFPTEGATIGFVQSWQRQRRSGRLEAMSATTELRPL